MNLLGLCGYAKSGKDTAAANMPGWLRVAFADPLKRDLAPMLGLLGVDLFTASAEDKEKIRPLLVAWGETARAFLPDFWIARGLRGVDLLNELRHGEPEVSAPNVVVTDVRYKNEVAAILARGGKVVRLHRPGLGPANREEERSIAEIEATWALPVVANYGTPADLGQRVMKCAGIIFEEGKNESRA